MPHYRAPLALLPDGWARDVLFEVDASGEIVSVAAGGARSAGERLPGVVVPGVPNLHSHAFQRALAGRAERGSPSGDSFWGWRERMYAFLGTLGPDQVEAIATQLYVEMLRQGYTTVVEFHYLHLDPEGRPYDEPAELALRHVAAARRAGIGLTLLPVLYQAGDFGGAPPAEGQRRFVLDDEAHLGILETVADELADDPDARVGIALHSLRAVTPHALRDAVAHWRGHSPDGPVHIHVAEQRKEVEGCLAWSGARPVEWLLEHAPVDASWCLVHATHLTDDEVLGLARSGAVAGLCPTTEANLGDGVFRLPDYLAAGGTWGIGSDSHVSRSPVEELRLLEYGQRLTRERRAVAPGPTDRSTGRVLLEGAWTGGARAAGRPLGRLAPGFRADWLVLDPDHPALVGLARDELLDGWVLTGTDSPVAEVWVGGRRVVERGRHVRQGEVANGYRKAMR